MRSGIIGGTRLLRRGRRGFTLTETAIVFSIFALVTAGVFLAASAARQHTQLNQGTDEISQIVGNMRSLYAGQNVSAFAGNPVGASLTFEQQLVQQGVFPYEMVSGGLAYHPWDRTQQWGSAQIAITGGTPVQFTLSYYKIPTNICISLLMANSTPGTDTGLQKIQVNGGALAALPAAAASAATACSGSATNTITWSYTLGG